MKRLWFIFLGLFSLTTFATAGIKDRLGIGFNMSTQKLVGNHATGTFELGGNPVNLRLNITPMLFLDTDVGFAKSGVVLDTGFLTTEMVNIGLKFGYRFLNEEIVNPLFYVGIGGLSYRTLSTERVYDGYASLGGGAELFLSDFFGLNLTSDYRFTSGDEFDGLAGGKGKDGFFNIALGLNYYFGGREPFDYAEIAEVMPRDFQQVEQVVTPEPNSAVEQINAEDRARLSFKKSQLLYSLAQRDQDIRLLKAKLATLNELAQDLNDRMEMAGMLGSSGDFDNGSDEDSYLVHYRNALVLFQAGYYENAIESFNTLLQENPFHALAGNWWYWLGESYYASKNYGEAIASFRKSELLNDSASKSEMIQLMIGLSHWKEGDTTEARVAFERLLTENPGGRFEEITKEYLHELQMD